MIDIFSYSFMVRAFIAGGIIALVAPIIGSFLVIKRYSLIADTLSHISLSGVALGFILGMEPTAVVLVVTVIAALLIEKLRSNGKIGGEAVLAMFLPAGLAVSLVLISLAKGVNINLISYLFGSISTVSPNDVIASIGLGLLTIILVLIYYKKLLYVSFDEESAKVSGINVSLINSLLMILTALTVSLSMRVVGVLLIGALMVIPVVASMQIAKSFRQIIIFAVLIALSSVFLGLFISYYANLPAGAVIVLAALVIFGLSKLIKP